VIATVATDIPQQQWGSFLEEFTRRHQGWLVEVQGEASPAPTTQEDPGPAELEAISMQLADRTESITVVTRHQHAPQGHRIHSIAAPTALRAEEHDDGKHKALVITTKPRGTAVVRVHQVIRPTIWTNNARGMG
jgi:hypothetical protein